MFIFQFLLKDRKGKTLAEEYDKYENTPLHVASKKGYVRIVQVSWTVGAHFDRLKIPTANQNKGKYQKEPMRTQDETGK